MFTTNASILPLSSTDDCTIWHGGYNRRLLLLSLLSLEIQIAAMVDGVTKFHLRPSGRSHLGILGSIIQPIDIEFDRIHFCSCFVRRIPVPGTGSIRKKRRTGNGFLSPLPHYIKYRYNKFTAINL